MTTGATASAGIVWLLSGQGLRIAAQFVSLVVLARLLPPADFGVVAAAMVVIELSETVSQLGFGPALVQTNELKDEYVRTTHTVSVLIGSLFFACALYYHESLGSFLDMPRLATIMPFLAVVFLLNGVKTVSQFLLQRQMRFRELAAVNAGAYTLGFVIVSIVLAFLGYGIWSLVIGHVVHALLRAIAMPFLCRHTWRPGISTSAVKELGNFGAGYTLARLGFFVGSQADNIVVAKMLGADALGFYNRAYRLMTLPVSTLGYAIDTVMFPIMSTMRSEPDRARGAYLDALAAVALVTLPASAGLWFTAYELISALLGPQWTSATPVFQILSLGIMFHLSFRVSDALATALGAVYARAWRQWVYAGSIVTATLIGVRWGLQGVAWGIIVALTLNWALMLSLCVSRLTVPWLDILRVHSRPILLASCVAGAAKFCMELVRPLLENDLLVLTIAILVMGATFALAIIAAPGIMLGPRGLRIAKTRLPVLSPYLRG